MILCFYVAERDGLQYEANGYNISLAVHWLLFIMTRKMDTVTKLRGNPFHLLGVFSSLWLSSASNSSMLGKLDFKSSGNVRVNS